MVTDDIYLGRTNSKEWTRDTHHNVMYARSRLGVVSGSATARNSYIERVYVDALQRTIGTTQPMTSDII